MEEAEENIESQIQRAMLSRLQHFTDQADSLTFEGVRRLLEKDLGLDAYALDVHKRFVKQLLEKYLKGPDDDSLSKNSGETIGKNVCSTIGEVAESPEKNQTKKDVNEPSSEDKDKTEDSPVMGLLTENKSTKSGMVDSEGNEKNEIPSEITVKKALWKRAAYFKANSEKVTMVVVRRLLEEDLELDIYSLDPLKKFISKELDEVLSTKVSKSASGVKKKSAENSQSKTSKKISKGGSSDSSVSESDAIEDDIKSKKRAAPKGKVQKFEGLKKRKRPAKETKVSSKKQKNLAETESKENSDAEDGGNVSEDGQSQSSAEKVVKKKEVPPPAYGKHVEHLKSIIKSCGMSVAPSVYKKAKQVPDNKREAVLIKELEEILSREGLSTNPTEKEIKEARKRKERAKELEGIDLSNIVLSSRRRSTTSFVAPPKPKIPVESDGDDAEESDKDDNNDDDDDENDDGDDNDVDGGDDIDSKSEEVQEEDEDSD